MRQSLVDLRDGEFGKILAVDVEGPLFRRLIEMGVTPGTRVQAIARAPLGDPMEILLRGYRLALRKSESSRIFLFS